jgi:riboflavin-specific deaminase-like protein
LHFLSENLREEPTLFVNMAMTLDGKVMRPDGKWYGLSSPMDRLRMDKYRMDVDALIVGKNSVIQDDPVVVPQNLKIGRRRPPVPVMICRNSLPPVEKKLFQQKDVRPLLLVQENLTPEAGEVEKYADVHFLTGEELEPQRVLSHLFKMGFKDILLEGGPALNHAFFQKDLVDVLYLTLVPRLIGNKDLPAIVHGAETFEGFDEREWELKKAETVGDELFLQYKRMRIHTPRYV